MEDRGTDAGFPAFHSTFRTSHYAFQKTAGRAPHSETPGPQELNLPCAASPGLGADAIRLIERTEPAGARLPRPDGIRESFAEPGHG